LISITTRQQRIAILNERPQTILSRTPQALETTNQLDNADNASKTHAGTMADSESNSSNIHVAA
jgi:hypothetical protein